MVGEPSRAAPELEFALGGRDFQGDTGRAWLVGDVPFNAFAHAISASRINLNITRRSHASVFASSSCRPFELAAAGAAIVSNPYEGIERWFEPGQELLVVYERRRGARGLPRPARRPGAGGGDGSPRPRARPRRAHLRAPGAAAALARRPRAPRRPLVPERRRLAIVPARNEEAAVGGVVARAARRSIRDLDVVVIDDGSTDATAEVAPRGRRGGRAALPYNLGIGGAVQTGFKYALEHGYEIVIRLDGDGQHDPQELPNLLAPLERGDADVVVGSRFADGNGEYKAAVRAPGGHSLVRAASSRC